MYYSSPANDVWSLGVILVNLACGRNPWKRASPEDPTFKAFLKDPHFLSSILPISSELETILGRIFECNPAKRISLTELQQMILACDSFTSHPQAPSPGKPTVLSQQPYGNVYETLTPLSDSGAYNDATTVAYTESDVFMSDSGSDDGSDTYSIYSGASSNSDYSESPATPYNETFELTTTDLHYLPQDPWRKLAPTGYPPTLLSQLQCY